MSEKVSILDKGIVLQGNVVSNGSVDISGKIKGVVVAETILVKEGGYIDGDVYAKELVLSKDGKIKGNLNVKSLKMFKGAEVEGQVFYSLLSIEDGAKLVGSCDLKDEGDVETLIDENKSKLNCFGDMVSN